MGIFDKLTFGKLKEGLTKTRESLLGKVHRMLAAKSKIDEETIGNLEEILLSGDVGVATTSTIIDRMKERIRKEKYENADELNDVLRDEIRNLFVGNPSSGNGNLSLPLGQKPHVMLIVGVNGVGKTTTIGKLAHIYKLAGYNVLIAAADTFRAAANEQLDIWAQRAGVEIIRQEHGADPAAVAFDALKAAVARGSDLLIIDTAGRLHNKVNLMEELKKIKRVLHNILPAAPHDVFLVLDASTGQNALQQAKNFSLSVGLTGLVLTKLDGTAKGGIVLSISNELDIPVKFIGVGERIDDLQPFDSSSFVEALLGK